MASSLTFIEILERKVTKVQVIKGDIIQNKGDAALPVRSGRVSVPESYGTLGSFLNELALIEPDFNLKFLEALECLAKYHPDLSQAVENVVTLGNTPYNIYFDDKVGEVQQKEMITRLKAKSKAWYAYSGGINSLINDLLAQIAIAGCISSEAVPDENLEGVKKVVLVSPKNIKFKYDRDKDEYLPHQIVPHTVFHATGSVELNVLTYSYIAMRRFGEKPYGIPPFMAALENVAIGKDMVSNLKFIVKKLGVLGFLEVLVNGPKPKNNEKDEDYFNRTQAYLTRIIPELEKGLNKGYVAGFKDQHEFNMHSTTGGNIQGAKDLIEVNDVKMMSGLKQDPIMFGRNFSTTETLARVILAKTGKQISNYQQIVATYLEKVFLLDLQLGGFSIEFVEVIFEPPMTGDVVRENTAYSTKLDNLDKLLNKGVIDIYQYATEAGYEEPADPEKHLLNIQDPNGEGGGDDPDGNAGTDPNGDDDATDEKTTGSNSKLLRWQMKKLRSQTRGGAYDIADIWIKGTDKPLENVIILGGSFPSGIVARTVTDFEIVDMDLADLVDRSVSLTRHNFTQFPYHRDGNCGCSDTDLTLSRDILNYNGKLDSLQDFITAYYKATSESYDAAIKKVTGIIGRELANLGQGATDKDVTELVMYHLYNSWDGAFNKRQKKVINKFVKAAYRFFRLDKSIFKGGKDVTEKIPKGAFSTIDFRAIDYFKNIDEVYLGKFITDPDVRKDITQHIKDEYLTRNLPIGKDRKAITEFKQQFAGLLQGKSWKIAQVISTTVARMRNTASVAYFEQAEVTEYEIRGVNDYKQCQYCANLQGKKFEVSRTMGALNSMYDSDPDFVGIDSPFITGLFKNADEMAELTGQELQDKGFHLVPAHPHCRDGAVPIL